MPSMVQYENWLGYIHKWIILLNIVKVANQAKFCNGG